MSLQSEISFPDKDKGYYCSCCGLFVKRYRRAINCNMALTLITLYRSGVRDYTHIEDLMRRAGYKRSGDFPYLVHWNFLEKKTGKRDDGSVRNGFYKLTGLGLLFVENKTTAKEKALIFNNKFEGFEGKEVSIHDALGKKFDYDKLMQNL